ncbi:MAG: hypothetical protein ACRDGN_00940 [bacterium]
MTAIYIVAWAALIAAVMAIGWLTARLAARETLQRDYIRARRARLRRRQDRPLTPTARALGNLVQFPLAGSSDRWVKHERKSAG